MVESIIALGTNLGDRAGNLRRAIGMIGRKMNLVGMSSVYETKPMYYEEQDWFLNCVVAVETDLRPHGLLRELQAMEMKLGRKRTVRYGPRVIDLDILFYGNEVISEPGLEIPHPKIAERPFVLVPLNEIRPDLFHPVLGRRTSELVGNLKFGAEQVIKRSGLHVDLVS